MELGDEISCEVKAGAFLSVGGSHSGSSDSNYWHGEVSEAVRPSGCQVVDVEIHDPVPDRIDRILFRNHYTHSVTIKFQTKQAHSNDPMHTLIRDLELMPNCHSETGAQEWIILSEKHFLTKLSHVTRLRLLLRQPSPHWKEFGIEDFAIFKTSLHECTAADLVGDGMENGSTSVSELGNGSDITAHLTDPTHPYEVNLLSYS